MLLLTCALSAHETGGTCCLVNKKRRGCAACSKNTQSLPHASSIKFDVHNELHTARYGLFYAKPTSPKLHSMFMQQDVCGICYSVDIQRLSSCFFFFLRPVFALLIYLIQLIFSVYPHVFFLRPVVALLIYLVHAPTSLSFAT